MAILTDIIESTDPANDSTGVPLRNGVSILFDREMDEDSVEEEMFVEGPDTDTYVGPGLWTQDYPPSISSGDPEDFLESPGYKGIVPGSYTFKKIDPSDSSVEVAESPYRTKVIFTPTHPFAALTDYKVHLPQAYDIGENLYSGYVTFEFVTGSGSIVEVPSTASTSVLNSLSDLNPLAAQTPLKVLKTTPSDREIKVPVDTSEIIIEFNKNIDAAGIADKISVKAIPVTDHPGISITANDELAKSVEVSGKVVKILL